MLSWYSVVTPLGTLVCKLQEDETDPVRSNRLQNLVNDSSNTVEIYDACMVTQRHVMRYFDEDDNEISEAQALQLGITEPLPCEATEDYVPIRPNVDLFQTSCVLNLSSIMLHWRIGENEALSQYIDNINGRIKVEDVEPDTNSVPIEA